MRGSWRGLGMVRGFGFGRGGSGDIFLYCWDSLSHFPEGSELFFCAAFCNPFAEVFSSFVVEPSTLLDFQT